MTGEHQLFAQLLYGTGLRLTEGLQLRVKDLDFAHRAVIVRHGKGGKDRVLMLPHALQSRLKLQLSHAHSLWTADCAAGRAGVEMPDALERKYPRAGASWSWFWVFPQATHSTDPRTGVMRRHPMYDQTFQRAFKRAVATARIDKPASPHTLRHAFATHLQQAGYDIRTSARRVRSLSIALDEQRPDLLALAFEVRDRHRSRVRHFNDVPAEPGFHGCSDKPPRGECRHR
jgi:integrase